MITLKLFHHGGVGCWDNPFCAKVNVEARIGKRHGPCSSANAVTGFE